MKFKLKPFENVIHITHIANIHYFEFTKQFHTQKDHHPFRELIYVDSGYIAVSAEAYEGIVNVGEVIVHRDNEIHSISCPLDDAPNVIIIGFACKDTCLDLLADGPIKLTPELQRLLTDVVKEGRSVFLPPYDVPNLRDMKKRADYPFGADQMIRLKLEAFFIELLRLRKNPHIRSSTPPTSSKLDEIRQYIDENYTVPIRLEELCFLFGTNKASLCHTFKEECGCTIVSYVNRKRIKASKRYLREGNRSLTEIAALVGFSSIHYFSRIFKQYEGQSPSEYIRSIKSKLML
mgnify:CR=1 FL=1